MSETYTIKPLEWENGVSDNDKAVYKARVGICDDYYEVWHNFNRGWGWWGTGPIVHHSFVPCESAESAKLAAESHWREHIKQVLVPAQKAGYHDVDAYYKDDQNEKQVQNDGVKP